MKYTSRPAAYQDSRPRNNANVVRVPYSASNRSSKGVKANKFMKAWKKPAWTNGNVFVLYTGWKVQVSHILPSWFVLGLQDGYLHVLMPISFGIKDPHCCTSNTGSKLANHKATITNIIALVNNGRRNMYERMRAAENCGKLGAMLEVASIVEARVWSLMVLFRTGAKDVWMSVYVSIYQTVDCQHFSLSVGTLVWVDR